MASAIPSFTAIHVDLFGRGTSSCHPTPLAHPESHVSLECLRSGAWIMMGSEVDNFLKFLSKHQMQRNSLNQIFKTLSYQEKMILSSNMYDKTYLKVSLKEFLKLLKCLTSRGIHTVSGWLDLLFKALHQERKRRKERTLTRLAWAPSVVVVLPLIYRHLV